MITTNRCTSLDPQPPSPMRSLPPSDCVYSFSSPTGTVFVCHWPFWLLHTPIPPQQLSPASFSPASSQSNAILHRFQQYKSPTRFLTPREYNPAHYFIPSASPTTPTYHNSSTFLSLPKKVKKSKNQLRQAPTGNVVL